MTEISEIRTRYYVELNGVRIPERPGNGLNEAMNVAKCLISNGYKEVVIVNETAYCASPRSDYQDDI